MTIEKIRLMQIIDSHVERLTNFEAALEFLCVTTAELKKCVGEMGEQKDCTVEIRKIKEILEHHLPNRFSSQELSLLRGFIKKNIDLCEQLLKQDEDYQI